MRKFYSLLYLLLLPLLSMAQITVTSTADSGAGTLRDAVAASAIGGTIDFNVGGTIVLTSGEISVDKELTIDGGSGGVTISGNNNSRVFGMPGTGDYTVNLINLQLENGSAPAGFGGVLECRAILNALNCTFRDSQGGNGGAVEASFNNANFVNCNFINNTSVSQGGALNLFGADFTLTNCLFYGNQSGSLGGAVVLGGTASVVINNSTITNNSAVSGAGGIWIGSPEANLTINNSIVANNTAPGSPDILNSGTLLAAFNNLITDSAGSSITIGTNGNITGNPLFFDPGNSNFQLTEGSPCVNTGDASLLPIDILDMDNDGDTGEIIPGDINSGLIPRVVNCQVDMGAFETVASNLYVTNTNDSGPGSLRAMIQCANSDPGLDDIFFNIPGAGPHAITILSQLPTLSDDGISIDGTTQSGYVDTPVIILDGNGGAYAGLGHSSDNGIIRGLKITNFLDSGISIFDCTSATVVSNIITGNAPMQIIAFGGTGHTIHDNIINIDENGTPNPMDSPGVWFQGPNVSNCSITNNTIGGLNNLNSALVVLIGSDITTVNIQNNFIGTNANGDNYGSPTNSGITIQNANTIDVRTNTIAFNSIGINNLGADAQQNLFTFNDFICNNIAIQNNGGANNNILPPAITSATTDAVTGTANADHFVEIYVQSAVACPGAGCQGEFVAQVQADAAGDWTFDPAGIPAGRIIAVIQVNPDFASNTSAFGTCEELIDPCNPDLTPPTITLLVPDVTVECGNVPPPLTPVTDMTATDACDGDISANIVFFDSNTVTLDCSAGGPKMILTDTYRITDANGNSTDAEWVITINDNDGPVWDDPSFQLTLNAECGDDIDALIAANIPTAFDECIDDGATVSIASQISGTTCGNAFEQSIFYQAVDLCGNVSADQYRVDIIVTDNTAPTFVSGPSQNITLPTDQGICGTVVSGLSVTVSDVCTSSGVTVTNDSPFANNPGADASGTYPPGAYTITFTATDPCLNSDTYVVNLTIVEPVPPTITGVPNDITIECGDPIPGFPVVGVDIFATDGNGFDISGDIIGDGVIVLGDCTIGEAMEVQTYTFFVADACGATVSDEYVITIVDTQAPVWDDASLSTTLNAECGDDIDALVAANIPSATDACGTALVIEISVTDTPDCGNTFTRTLTYTTTDDCNNTNPAPYTVTINVTDTTPPVIGNVPNDITISCGDAYPDLDVLMNQIVFTDNCDATINIIVLGPPVVTGCSPVPSVIEDVYSITAEDACGNSASASFSIFINNDLLVDLGADMTICDGAAVTLDAGNPGSGYEWSTGETTQTISVSTPGTYSVTVTGGNTCCNVDEINIMQGTTPDVTATGGTLDCINSSVQLMANSTTTGVTYSWVGPNNFSSDQQNPTVTMQGAYTVTATSAEGCTATADAMVVQDAGSPDASATGGTLTCVITSVQIMGSSTTTGVSFSWTGPNSFLSGDQNPMVSDAGTYTLTVSAPNGCTATATTTVTDDTTAPLVTATGGALSCTMTSIQLMADGTPTGGNYSWTGPNSFVSNEQNPIVTMAGDYIVTCTSANGCTGMATATVTGDTSPPDALATGGMLDCTTTSVQLMGSSTTTGVSFGWIGPNSFVSNEQNPSVSTSGTYTLTVTAPNGCTATANATVTQDAGTPTVTATGGALDCSNAMVQLMANSPTAGGTYSWTGPNSFVSNDQNPQVSEVGTYTVTIEAPNGCTAFANAQVTEDLVNPNASAMGGTLDCVSGTLILTGNSTTTGVSYSWDGPSAFSSNQQNPTVNEVGTYTLTVTGANGCTATATAIVDANTGTAPTSSFTVQENDLTVDFMDTSTGAPDTWAWDFGDGMGSSDQNPQHIYFTAGTYTVCQTVSNTCGDNTTCQSITVDAGTASDLITFEIGTVSGQPGDIVQVPVSVENFTDVVSFQKSIHVVDPTIARLISISDFNLTELDATDFNVASDETITSVWFNANPVDVPNGTVIYMINVELLSTVDACTGIFMDDNPTFVEIATLDGTGNIMGMPYLLKGGDVCIISKVDISGNILRENGQTLDEVVMECTDQASTTNDAAGYYEFLDVTAGQDYTVTPSRNTNHVDGVTAIDLALIQRHILNVQLLDSPYKIIAADVDISGLVSGIDLVKIQQLILGITTEFPDFNSWRFVDQKYTFVNPANPIQEAFPEVIDFIALDRDTIDNDFIAMKLGDVNETAMGLQEPGTGILNLVINETTNAFGEQLIEFRSADFTTISAYQFDILFDHYQMDFMEVIPGALPGLNETFFAKNRIDEGLLKTLWYDPTATEGGWALSPDEVLFTLKFSAIGTQTALQERIQTGVTTMKSAGYTHSGEALDIQTSYAATLTDADDVLKEQAQLFAVQPNPFHRQATVPFFLPESSEIQVQIQDVSGKVVKVIRGDYMAGKNELLIDGSDLNGAGMYYLTFQSGQTILTQKLIFQP